jgi:L-asparaginase II
MPVVVRAFRGPVVESDHFVSFCATLPNGEIECASGDLGRLVPLRSTAKPFIAVAILTELQRLGIALQAKEIAVIAGSHGGERVHLDTIASLLRRFNIPENALECGAHLPLHDASADELLRNNKPLLPMHNNCSGKHAGLLILARARNEALDGYISPTHPVQALVLSVLADFLGTNFAQLAVVEDGCGLLVPAETLPKLARAFCWLLNPPDSLKHFREASEAVLNAVHAYPELSSATGFLEAELSRITDGRLYVKNGAEGVYAVLDRASGIGMALKVHDGNRRALGPVLLRLLDDLQPMLADDARCAVHSIALPAITNVKGAPVGRLEIGMYPSRDSSNGQRHSQPSGTSRPCL